jgi:hypothetical protein
MLPSLAVTSSGGTVVDSVREWRTFSAAADWQGVIDDLERRGVGAKATFTTLSGRVLLLENVGRRSTARKGRAR